MTDRLQTLWQDIPVQMVEIPTLRSPSSEARFHIAIGWRNLREYIGAGLVFVIFSTYAMHFSSVLIKTGAVLNCLAAIFVVFHLHRKGRLRPLSPGDECRNFYLQALKHQQALLRSAWAWYLIPWLPGTGLFFFGILMPLPEARRAVVYLAVFFVVSAFAGIGWLNHYAAQQLKNQIDKLEH